MIVSEIFGPVIQGEGPLIGMPTVFLRTAYCDFRCSWCDTMYAVDPAKFAHQWSKMSPEDAFHQIRSCSSDPILVTLSGGNPALHSDLEQLVQIGHEQGYTFAMETQGSIFRAWFRSLDYLIVSPKPPSSDMHERRYQLHEFADLPNTCFKVVVFDDLDYDWARSINEQYPDVPFFLQVGNPNPHGQASTSDLLDRLRWLCREVIQDGWTTARVLPQLHVLLWGNERGR